MQNELSPKPLEKSQLALEVRRFTGGDRRVAAGEAREQGIEAWYTFHPSPTETQVVTTFQQGGILGGGMLETRTQMKLRLGEGAAPIDYTDVKRTILDGWVEVEEVPGKEAQPSTFNLVQKRFNLGPFMETLRNEKIKPRPVDDLLGLDYSLKRKIEPKYPVSNRPIEPKTLG